MLNISQSITFCFFISFPLHCFSFMFSSLTFFFIYSFIRTLLLHTLSGGGAKFKHKSFLNAPFFNSTNISLFFLTFFLSFFFGGPVLLFHQTLLSFFVFSTISFSISHVFIVHTSFFYVFLCLTTFTLFFIIVFLLFFFFFFFFLFFSHFFHVSFV